MKTNQNIDNAIKELELAEANLASAKERVYQAKRDIGRHIKKYRINLGISSRQAGMILTKEGISQATIFNIESSKSKRFHSMARIKEVITILKNIDQ